MAEIVYKDIPDLPTFATVPLAGTELIEVSQTGVSKKGLWSGFFGAGWWAKLAAAFSAFKAPDADHADNADTLGSGEEVPADFHDATQLSGLVPLANIPNELTGKNAASATLAASATNADTVDGYHAGEMGTNNVYVFRGYVHGAYAHAAVFAILDSVIPSNGDMIPVCGSFVSTGGTLYAFSRAYRVDASTIYLYGCRVNSMTDEAAFLILSPSSVSSGGFSFCY